MKTDSESDEIKARQLVETESSSMEMPALLSHITCWIQLFLQIKFCTTEAQSGNSWNTDSHDQTTSTGQDRSSFLGIKPFHWTSQIAMEKSKFNQPLPWNVRAGQCETVIYYRNT